MPSPESLFGSILFGAIGLAFFLRGKREGLWIPIVLGIALMGFPYFISETVPLFLAGAVLTAVAYIFRG